MITNKCACISDIHVQHDPRPEFVGLHQHAHVGIVRQVSRFRTVSTIVACYTNTHLVTYCEAHRIGASFRYIYSPARWTLEKMHTHMRKNIKSSASYYKHDFEYIILECGTYVSIYYVSLRRPMVLQSASHLRTNTRKTEEYPLNSHGERKVLTRPLRIPRAFTLCTVSITAFIVRYAH